MFERRHDGAHLTAGGRSVIIHVRRALAELDAIKSSASHTGCAIVGRIRLGVRMPPIGKPVSGDAEGTKSVAAEGRLHILAVRTTLAWASLRDETILVQGWDESQAQREFFASLLGSGVRFQTHAAPT